MSLGPPVWGSGTWGSATWGAGTWAGASSSTQRLVQCRAGIERAGASRTGYFTPNVVVEMNGTVGGISLQQDSLEVHLARNDEPSTASFTMNPGSTVPALFQPVIINLGSVGNPILAGQVIRVGQERRIGNPEEPFIKVDVIDWLRLFDRRLITHTWTSASATDIATDIVDDYTTGFTGVGIEASLPTIDEFVCVNEKPSVAFRRLVTLIGGGGFVITPDRDVRFFDTSGDLAIGAHTNPTPLWSGLSTLKSFSHTYDGTQQRNRVIGSGVQQKVLVDVPVGVTTLPIEYPYGFSPFNAWVRFGTQLLFYNTCTQLIGPPACVVTVDANPGDTSITVDNAVPMYITGLNLFGWAHTSGGSLFYHRTTGASPTTLISIPASGYGSLLEKIPAGTPLYAQDAIWLSITTPTTETIAAGSMATYVTQVNDLTSQAALAASEGGDGIHEHAIDVSAAGYVGVGAVADADLAAFAGADGNLEVDYLSTDMNVCPGTTQAIAFTGTHALTASLTIESVDLSFPILDSPPFRRARASDIKLIERADVLADLVQKGA